MTLTLIFPLISMALSLPLAICCLLLSRRLRRLNDLETGLGGAIAVMTAEISRLDQAIRRARAEAEEAGAELARAIEAARTEKAHWALQAELSRAAHPGARRLRPRETSRENAHV